MQATVPFVVDAFDQLTEKAVTSVVSVETIARAIAVNDRAIDRRARCVGSTDRLRAALAAPAARPAGLRCRRAARRAAQGA